MRRLWAALPPSAKSRRENSLSSFAISSKDVSPQPTVSTALLQWHRPSATIKPVFSGISHKCTRHRLDLRAISSWYESFVVLRHRGIKEKRERRKGRKTARALSGDRSKTRAIRWKLRLPNRKTDRAKYNRAICLDYGLYRQIRTIHSVI